jgi:transposase
LNNNGNRARVEALTLQGWSASEIGRELGIAVGTVYSHRHEARKRVNNPMPQMPVRLAGGRPRREALRAVDTQCERGAFGSA